MSSFRCLFMLLMKWCLLLSKRSHMWVTELWREIGSSIRISYVAFFSSISFLV